MNTSVPLIFCFSAQILFSNSLFDCCGLFLQNETNLVRSVNKEISLVKRIPSHSYLGDTKITQKKFGEFQSNESSNRTNFLVSNLQSFPQRSKTKLEGSVKEDRLSSKENNFYNPSKLCYSNLQSPNTSSVPHFVYAPRVKSIRVSSVPDIERWERSLREEMKLNGRSKQTVNRLLARIKKHYGDASISAMDYSPGRNGYSPSQEKREFAEEEISNSLDSLTKLFENSDNLDVKRVASSDIEVVMHENLDYINIQLRKLNKKVVSMNELKEILVLKLGEKKEKRFQASAQIQVQDPFNLDQSRQKQTLEVNEKVEQLYVDFARLLDENDKPFPSLDPKVDLWTLNFYDRVNHELSKIGKFETILVFRENVLAHLDEILDNRGQKLKTNSIIPEVESGFHNEFDSSPVNKPSKAVFNSQLVSLPGKKIPLEKRKNTQMINVSGLLDVGKSRTYRVMNNLPGNQAF